jgi:hypothetical protein
MLEVQQMVKVTRSDIRLAYSLAAELELNAKLHALEAEFWYGFTTGQNFYFDRLAQQVVLERDTRLHGDTPPKGPTYPALGSDGEPLPGKATWQAFRVDPEAVAAALGLEDAA